MAILVAVGYEALKGKPRGITESLHLDGSSGEPPRHASVTASTGSPLRGKTSGRLSASGYPSDRGPVDEQNVTGILVMARSCLLHEPGDRRGT
jgi:hypothetical protein